MIIKNGQVLLFEEGGFVKRDILVKDGKIIKVAEGISPEEAGEEIVDAKGKFITPGLIDAHSHICISEEGMGAIADDCNDYSDAVMPYLETIDGKMCIRDRCRGCCGRGHVWGQPVHDLRYDDCCG